MCSSFLGPDNVTTSFFVALLQFPPYKRYPLWEVNPSGVCKQNEFQTLSSLATSLTQRVGQKSVGNLVHIIV